ncbi:hypothetical protein FOMPIDRAFT_83947 [Fomitopsis schrenkii]|uniref:Uncharacterized protein n=1 Tax=Fomitopsis schrenkii TaxID=2126942 RepID=S8EPA9_FOMSC|nr:hypothetical protein FOMPIDRAFT_83947 [Fomitopsis schrenkii]
MKETSYDTDKDGDMNMREPVPLSVSVPMPSAAKEQAPQPERRRSRSPPVAPRNYAPTPPTPSSPHPSVSLPIKPSWSRRSTKQAETPTVESPSSATQSTFSSRPKTEPDDPVLKALTAEIAGAQKIRLAAAEEYKSMLLQKQRTTHELQLANLDLRAAQMRRMIAEDQLERAKAGELGVEYNGIPAALPTAII